MIQSYERAGIDFSVNTNTSGAQYISTVTPLSTGGYVIAWTDDGDAFGSSVRARIYNSLSEPVSGEILLDASGRDIFKGITALAGGGFVVNWSEENSYTPEMSRARIYDGSGNATTAEFEVNYTGSIAGLEGGGFVISWTQYVFGAGNVSDVFAQRYSIAGEKVGGVIAVNALVADSQSRPSVDSLPGGGFVITWRDDAGSATDIAIKAQIFDANGEKVGPEVAVGDVVSADQYLNPVVATLTSGNIAIAWHGPGASGTIDTFAQVITTGGVLVGGPILVNTETTGIQKGPSIAALPDGGFAIAWDDTRSGPSILYYDIFMQVFDANGSKVAGELLVNSVTDSPQQQANIGVLADGQIVVSWSDSNASLDDVFGGVRAQAFVVSRNGTGDGDAIVGTAANDAILGLAGQDLLDLSAGGNDTASGGENDDTLLFGSAYTSRDRVDGGSGYDALVLAGDYSTKLILSQFNLQNIEEISLGVGFDYSIKLHNNNVFASANLRISAENLGISDSLDFDGADELDGAFTVLGGQGNDIISGGAGSDNLIGGNGNNQIAGGQGADVVVGGNGGDRLFSDRYALSAPSPDGARIDLGQEHDSISAGAGDDEVWIGIGDDADGGSGSDRLNLTFNAALAGVSISSSNLLSQEPVTVLGGAISGFEALGVLVGSEFSDTFSVFSAVELYTRNGADIVDASLSGGGVSLDGGAGNDFLTGGAFDDTLIGGTGNDTLSGRSGNDIYWIDSAGDSIVELAGEGSDVVITSVSYTLDAATHAERLETIKLSATDSLNLTGNSYSQAITGNNGRNILRGEGGADALYGGGDNDVMDGGSGADAMYGGTGDDTYYIDVADDRVFEEAGQGADRMVTSASYVLASTSEIEQLEFVTFNGAEELDLTGNGYAQTIYGNNGVNVLRGEGGADTLHGGGGGDFLDGGTGADAMFGGTGDDTYYVDVAGDRIFEEVGQGYDRVALSIDYTLPEVAEVELVEAITLSSTTALQLGGSDLANTIYGNAGNNVLRGFGGSDTLYALSGNDALDGGTGADAMFGGLGDDTYYVDNVADRIWEYASEGYDRVAAIISINLPDDAEVELVEAINLASTARMDIGGSSSANILSGNAGVNVLHGYGANDTLYGFGGDDYLAGDEGIDTMVGGTGNDTYYVDNSADLVIELANEGTADRVAISASFTLAASANIELLEVLDAAGTGAFAMVGSESGNTIVGNAGANLIDGRGASDVLTGNGGADIFRFSSAIGSGNVDIITDFAVGTDKIALDAAIFAAFNPGSLDAGYFTTGSAATGDDQRIIYNSATGSVLYDADGAGDGAAIHFAQLAAGLSLSASDFVIV